MPLLLIFSLVLLSGCASYLLGWYMKKGIADEIAYPLANCDTSMYEECMPDNKHLRILHVNDQAGVAGVLAKYQKKLGHTVKVVVRRGYDSFGMQTYYGETFVGLQRRDFANYGVIGKVVRLIYRSLNVCYFYFYVAWTARRFDIVHIHSQYLVSFLIPFKSKLIHFHGSDIRDYPSNRWCIDKWVTSLFLKANKKICFCVSTTDLLKTLPQAVYIANPVDTELFNKRSIGVGYVYVCNWYEKERVPKITAATKNVTLLQRCSDQKIMYADMPRYLSNFMYFIDRNEIKSLSKTALEALALGLKVVTYDNKIIAGLPNDHNAEFAAEKCVNIYKEIIYAKHR